MVPIILENMFRKTFANVGATIADNFDVEAPKIGTSLLDRIVK